MNNRRTRRGTGLLVVLGLSVLPLGAAHAEDAMKTRYSPVAIKEPFRDTMKRMENAKPGIMKRQKALLEERYDLSDRPAKGVMKSGGRKAVQEGGRVKLPSRGVTCFGCHSNGHSNAATHLVGDIRPQELRHRLDTPPLRGVNIQRLFGSQRVLKSVEDFTEFEQRAACFDGGPVIGTKKGINVLERGSQVHFMAEFQEILDFPPAPKLTLEDTVEFFNLIQGLKPNNQEKQDLVAFMRAL